MEQLDKKTFALALLGIVFIVVATIYYAVDYYIVQERLGEEERARIVEQQKRAVPPEVLRVLSAPQPSAGSTISAVIPGSVLQLLTAPVAKPGTKTPQSTPSAVPPEVLKSLSVPQ